MQTPIETKLSEKKAPLAQRRSNTTLAQHKKASGHSKEGLSEGGTTWKCNGVSFCRELGRHVSFLQEALVSSIKAQLHKAPK